MSEAKAPGTVKLDIPCSSVITVERGISKIEFSENKDGLYNHFHLMIKGPRPIAFAKGETYEVTIRAKATKRK